MTAQQIKVSILVVLSVLAAAWSAPQRYFPNIPGYQTLVGDFHTHTVFSDGLVWPTVRIQEAVREKLDFIALTDHIEYQPHKRDIPTNHARPFEIAQPLEEEKGILLIRGAEISRDTPPGHYNAVFLTSIQPLQTESFLDAVERANAQKGFVFWNHHDWQGPERGRWEAIQTEMYEKGWLHGLEVANGDDYYPQAHRWCLEKKLTMLGNSDIHDPSYFSPYSAGRHRTVTLVFAVQKSVPAVQEALAEGRTAVWHKNQLIGREEFLTALLEASMQIEPHWTPQNTLTVTIHSRAMIELELEAAGPAGTAAFTVPAFGQKTVEFPAGGQQEGLTLDYCVKNFLIKPGQGLTGQIRFPKPQ